MNKLLSQRTVAFLVFAFLCGSGIAEEPAKKGKDADPKIGLEKLDLPDEDAEREKKRDDRPAVGLPNGYRLQEADDVATPLKPLKPRSAAIDAKLDGLSWYMVGRLLDTNHRNAPRKSLESLRRAVKADPNAIEVYRSLIPLEVGLGNVAEALRLASKSVQLDPEDFESLQLLAQQAAKSGQLPEAIKLLEQAIKSSQIEKTSSEYVILNRSLGTLYAATGQKEQAADCYQIVFDAIKSPDKFSMDQRDKMALLNEPNSSYEFIGQIMVDANRLKPALEAFELAAKTSRLGAGSLSYNRARILFLSEKYDEALAELDKYFDAQRTSKQRLPYQLLADILAKLNRSDELIRRLETMAESDAQNPYLQYFLAEKLTDINELERARKIYDTILRNGGDASGYAGLARVLRKMQNSDDLLHALGRGFARGEDAIKDLEPEVKALTEDKTLVASLFESGRNFAKDGSLKFEESLLLAKIAAAISDAEISGEFYRQAIALNREGAQPNVLIQMDMAKMYFALRKYKLAIDAFNELLASRQLNELGQAICYWRLAQSLSNDNRPDEALEAIAKAIALEDENVEYRFWEAWIYSHAKRWDEAVVKYNQLINDFPDEKFWVLQSQFVLSNVYVQKKEMRKGEEILEKVLETNPDSSQANNDLGYLWADQGKNLEQAEKMIRKALAAEPDNGAYLDSLGWVLFKQGRTEEAIPPLEQATQKSQGGDGTIWDHLGDILLKANQIEKAVDAWKTGLKHLEDDSSQDTQLLERIQEKVKQHGSNTEPKPSDKDAP